MNDTACGGDAAPGSGEIGRFRCVVIGYGNDLRGDDAAGRRAAEAVAAWEVPGVLAVSVHQLTPELSEWLAKTERVVFVDAYPAAPGQNVQVAHLKNGLAARETLAAGHFGDPGALLELTGRLYDHVPQAWLVAVPAIDFSFSETLSAVAIQGLEEALTYVRNLATGTGFSEPGMPDAGAGSGGGSVLDEEEGDDIRA